jgi:ribosomal protein L1
MPNPKVGCVVPPNANLKSLVDNLQKTVRAVAKTASSVKLKAGHEDMKPEDVAENMQSIHHNVLHKLPQEKNNIKNVLVKKTMSPPIKVEEK